MMVIGSEGGDKTLKLLIHLMSYCLLRPVEACRLQVKDLDIKEKTLTVRTKTKHSKIKRIPDLMMSEFEAWDLSNPLAYIITLDGVAESDFSPEHRRMSFTKRFTKVRDLLKFSSDYTLYSFRHTSITKLYRKLRENNGKMETYDKLMPITGHSTVVALEKYLRDIDAELPGDYSDLFD
jgi:integrase